MITLFQKLFISVPFFSVLLTGTSILAAEQANSIYPAKTAIKNSAIKLENPFGTQFDKPGSVTEQSPILQNHVRPSYGLTYASIANRRSPTRLISITKPKSPIRFKIGLNGKMPNNWKRFMNYQWQDNSDNEERFVLYRKKRGDKWKAIKTFNRAGTRGMKSKGQLLYYTDNNLRPGTFYCYYVRTSNAAGSTLTAARCKKTHALQKPAAPSYLSIGTGTNDMTLGWNDRSNNETGFYLSGKKTGLFNNYKTRRLPANTTRHLWTGLKAGTKYCFKIKSFNPDGKSRGIVKCAKTHGGSPSNEYNTTLFLRAQPIIQGYIPYVGRYPIAGSSNYQLLSIQNPSQTMTLLFLKRGYSNSSCNNQSAVVRLGPKQQTTNAKLQALFGSSKPKLPVHFIACISATNTNTTQVPINLRIQKN